MGLHRISFYHLKYTLGSNHLMFRGEGGGDWKMFSGLDIFSLATGPCLFICI